jgi:hypothetical protein
MARKTYSFNAILLEGIAAAGGERWLFGVPGGTDGRDFFRELGLDPGDPISFSNHEKITRYTSGESGKTYGAAVFQKMQEEAQARALMPELTDEQKEVWRTGAHWLAELTVGC